MKNTTPLIRTSSRWLVFWGRCILSILALAAATLLPEAHAVNPPPDGGYPGLNTAEGENALLNLTTGSGNTAVGSFSLENLSTGNFNTGIGADTLALNTGDANTATGAAALLLNTTGTNNTADGTATLVNNSTGSDNTAIGAFALNSNTDSANTAIGSNALLSNTIGSENTANGAFALFSNTAGNDNTATGISALQSNTTGFGNTANGASALFRNTDGGRNTANGEAVLFNNTTGDENTANGALSLQANTEGSGNTAVGIAALTSVRTGDFNTALGANAGDNLSESDSNNIDIGANVEGVAGESNTIRIGNPDITNAFIRGISGTTIATGDAVFVASNGHLGTITSSRRFKKDIKPMDRASEAIFSMKPVTFRYKKEIDPTGTQQFGLLAEEVEKLNPDLVVRDEQGRVNSVRYDQVNAMLLNEFLKEHKKVEELRNEFQYVVALQKKQIVDLTAKVRQQTEQIQKVCAQTETKRPATKVALNNP